MPGFAECRAFVVLLIPDFRIGVWRCYDSQMLVELIDTVS